MQDVQHCVNEHEYSRAGEWIVGDIQGYVKFGIIALQVLQFDTSHGNATSKSIITCYEY